MKILHHTFELYWSDQYKPTKYLLLVFLAIGFFFFAGPGVDSADALTCTAATSSTALAWNTIGTWSCGRVPQAGDSAIIGNGTGSDDITKITVSSTPATNPDSLTINSTAATSTVTLSGGVTLTITNNVTINGPSSNGIPKRIEVGASTNHLNIGGTLILVGGNVNRPAEVTATTGTVTVGNGMTFSTGSAELITTTGAATINVTGTIGSGGTVTLNSATTVKFTGTSQINNSYTYPIVQVNTGTLTINGTPIFGQSVTVASGASWSNTGNNAVEFRNGFTNSNSGGALSMGTGTHTFSTNSQSITGTGGVTFGGAVTIGAGLTVTNTNTASVSFAGALEGGDSNSQWTNSTNAYLRAASGGTMFVTNGKLAASATGNTIEYAGTNQAIKSPVTNYYNLKITGSNNTSPTITVANTLKIGGAGTFTPSSGTITLSGSGTAFRNDGTFTASGTQTVAVTNVGSVTLATSNDNVTFFNLTLSGGGTVLFTADRTYTTAGTLTISNITNINSTTGSSQWFITHTGASESVNAGTIDYSGCVSSNVITVTAGTEGDSVDACWDFPAAVASMIGTIYSDELGTVDPIATSIYISVDGGTAKIASSSAGTYSIQLAATPSDGQIVTIWINNYDGSQPKGSLIFAYGSTYCDGGTADCTGRNIYENRVSLDTKNASSLAISDLTACNDLVGGGCTDADIGFDTTSGLTLNWATNELYVSKSFTFAPGGNVSAQKLDVEGTYIGGSETITLSGTGTSTTCTDGAQTPLCIGPSGLYSRSTSTVAYTSGTTATIYPTIYKNLTIGGTGTYTGPGSDATVLGTLTVTSGATYASGSGTWLFRAGGAQTLTDNTAGKQNLGEISVRASTSGNTTLTASTPVRVASATVDSLQVLSVSNKLTINGTSGQTLDLNGTISGAGRLVYRSTTAFPTTGTITAITVFDSKTSTPVMSARTYGGDVEITNNGTSAAGIVTMAAGTPYTFSGNLYIIASTSQDITLNGATNDPAVVDVAGDLDYTGTAGGTEIITSGTGDWQINGNANFSDGTFTTEAGNTLTMDGTGTLTSNGQTLQNLTLAGTTITLANANHTMAGNLILGGTTLNAGSSTITMTGTSNTITGGGKTLNNLTIDPSSAGTITLQTSDLTVSGQVIVEHGDAFAINSGRTLALSGSGTPLVLYTSGTPSTFSPNSASTVTYSGTSATTIAPTNYGILNLTPAATVTYTLASASSQTIGTNGAFTIGNGSNAVTVSAVSNKPAINIFNNMTIDTNAIYASGSNTTTFKSGASQTLTDSTASKMNLGEIQVSANGTNTTLTLGSDIRIASATIDASQILSAGANTITISSVSSPFTVNGIFKPGTGTVVYTGSGATNISATKYNNLTIGGAGTYSGPDSGTTTILGNLAITSGATYASRSATLFFRKGGSQSVTDNNTTKQNLGEIAVQASTSGNTTLTLGGSIRIASATIDALQTLDANGSNTLTITNADSGGGVPFTASGSFGIFTPSTGTVVFTGNGATSIPTLDYNNLKIQPSANSVTHTLLSGTVNVSKTFTVGNGTNTSVIVTAITNDSGLDVASVSISANTTLIADDDQELTIAGNFTNNGSFTHSNGTVTFENIRTASVSGATTFYKFTSSEAGKKIKFGAGEIFTFSNFNFNGQSGNTVYIESTASASQWLAHFNNPPTISYATITDSGCDTGTSDANLQDDTSVRGTNNGPCWVFPIGTPVKTSGGTGPSYGGQSGVGTQQSGGPPSGGDPPPESGGGDPEDGGDPGGGGDPPSPVIFIYWIYR